MRSLVECLELLTVSKHINVVVGDFDLPKINWATFSCPDNFIHKPFLDFTVDNGFSQFVQFVTNNKNRPILDLVLSDYYDRYVISQKSHHLGIVISVAFLCCPHK